MLEALQSFETSRLADFRRRKIFFADWMTSLVIVNITQLIHSQRHPKWNIKPKWILNQSCLSGGQYLKRMFRRFMFHRSAIVIKQKIHLNECIRKPITPIHQVSSQMGITFYFDQTLRHHIIQNKFKNFLTANQINFVQRQQNPCNVPQARSIETIWSLLERKVYEGAWETKNLNQLARRIILKAKQLDQNVVKHMILGVRRKLLKVYTDSVYSVW